MKKTFSIISFIGLIIISICSFTIPSNPYEILPALVPMSFDKPLWFAYLICFGFIYELILLYIYDKINYRDKNQKGTIDTI